MAANGAGQGAAGSGAGAGEVVWGDYRIVREVARGGMGVVYEALQEGLGRRVALKLLLRTNDAALHRFRREMTTVASLRHPNIVTIYDAGERDGRPFIAMEFIDGRPLDRVIQDGIAPRDAAAVVRECARAMAYAHGRGVIHRDLKPANIIVDAAGVPKITDFGLAKEMGTEDRLTRTGTILGTPFYMAPEQLRGRVRDLDARADIYALGVVLYEALTGTLPYRAASPVLLLRAMESGPPLAPSQVGPTPAEADLALLAALDAIALKALACDPNSRYPAADDLAADLQQAIDGRRPPAGTAGAPASRRRLAACAAAALLVLGLAIAWRFRPPPETNPAAPSPAAGGAAAAGTLPPPPAVPDRPVPARLSLLDRRRLAAEVMAATSLESGRAVPLLRSFAEVAPDDPLIPALQTERPGILPAEQDAEVAHVRAALDTRLAAAPGDAEALVARASVRHTARDLDGALLDCDRAEPLAPDDPWVPLTRARILVSMGRLDEALAAGEEAVRRGPGISFFEASLAAFVCGARNPDRAIAILEDVLMRQPNDAFAQDRLAACLITAGRVRQAEDAESRALASDPEALFPRWVRGYLRETTGRPQLALEDYRAYAAGGGRMAMAYLRAGLLAMDQEDDDAALTFFTQTIERDPRSVNAFFQRAQIQGQRGNVDAALADIENAIRIDDRQALFFGVRGHCHLERGELEAALADYTRACTLDPANRDMSMERGCVLMRLSRYPEAATELLRIRGSEASDPRLVRWLALCSAEPSTVQDLDRARGFADIAERLDPQSEETWYVSARVHELSGDRAAAASAIRRAIDLAPADSPDLPTYRAMLGRLQGP